MKINRWIILFLALLFGYVGIWYKIVYDINVLVDIVFGLGFIFLAFGVDGFIKKQIRKEQEARGDYPWSEEEEEEEETREVMKSIISKYYNDKGIAVKFPKGNIIRTIYFEVNDSTETRGHLLVKKNGRFVRVEFFGKTDADKVVNFTVDDIVLCKDGKWYN